jgi:glucose/arabinose dehydrogenase
MPSDARAHRLGLRSLAALGMVAGMALMPVAAGAATSCYAVSCATVCTPDAPLAISTLVLPGQFPAGATTPIAFVDPGDRTSKRLIATQQGAILVWDGATGALNPTPFLDLRAASGGPVACCGERGLLALAVDPAYTDNGFFYVFYTRNSGAPGPGALGDIVIARYQRSAANPDVADPASATALLVIHHPAGNHNGGWLAFGPDGFLYISTGDGGGSCDGNLGANGDGQRPGTLNGKMLRIDVRGIDPGAGPPDNCSVAAGPYTVPASNPYVGQLNACDEVWAIGLRNPFRFSFDRETGDLYIGDVGQNKWEEINLQRASTPAPVNFGWVCREGCESANTASGCSITGCPIDGGSTCEFPRTVSGFWDPVLCHRNPGWRSIMGGYRYRGILVPSIAGDYFYGDNVCGQIWKTTTLDPANPAAIAATCWASGYGGTYGFAEDHLGELYVVRGGASRIECIHNGEGCYWAGWGGLFEDGFETGDTSRWSFQADEPGPPSAGDLTPAAGG